MTPWHYRWLCQFAYIDLPADVPPSSSLRDLTALLLRRHESAALPCGRLADPELESLRVILNTPSLSALALVEFINRNSSTGLVVYVLRSPDGGFHLVFRGSESRGCGVPTGVDWVDNLLAPFHGSIQYPEIASIARRYPDARVVFSGHSKGAHNALYALASLPNERARAVVFNGQGFTPGQLTRPQQKRLSRQAVNYVARGDLVGSLLWHPEKRVFTRRQGTGNAHALSAFAFDRNGRPLPALRPIWSFALEWSSRLAAGSAAAPAVPALPESSLFIAL